MPNQYKHIDDLPLPLRWNARFLQGQQARVPAAPLHSLHFSLLSGPQFLSPPYPRASAPAASSKHFHLANTCQSSLFWIRTMESDNSTHGSSAAQFLGPFPLGELSFHVTLGTEMCKISIGIRCLRRANYTLILKWFIYIFMHKHTHVYNHCLLNTKPNLDTGEMGACLFFR